MEMSHLGLLGLIFLGFIPSWIAVLFFISLRKANRGIIETDPSFAGFQLSGLVRLWIQRPQIKLWVFVFFFVMVIMTIGLIPLVIYPAESSPMPPEVMETCVWWASAIWLVPLGAAVFGGILDFCCGRHETWGKMLRYLVPGCIVFGQYVCVLLTSH